MNEWQPIDTAPKDGTLCWLRFRDQFGWLNLTQKSGYFLHDDGNWYQVQPPTRLAITPAMWMAMPAKGTNEANASHPA